MFRNINLNIRNVNENFVILLGSRPLGIIDVYVNGGILCKVNYLYKVRNYCLINRIDHKGSWHFHSLSSVPFSRWLTLKLF